jgi:Skp family chaperone for outer membrane proteins
LQEQLNADYTNDLDGLKYHHENQLQAMNLELEKLKGMLYSKNEEIENLQKEKSHQRENY